MNALYRISALNQMHFICPSGNCLWDPFATLGLEAVCTDLSSQTIHRVVNNGGVQSNYSLPSWGPSIAFSDVPGKVASVDTFFSVSADSSRNYSAGAQTMRAIQAVFNQHRAGNCEQSASSGMGGYLAAANSTIIATSCSLYLAIYNITASVTGGVYTEQIHSMHFANNTFGYDYAYPFVDPPSNWSSLAQGRRFGINRTIYGSIFEDTENLAPSAVLPNPLLAGSVVDADDHCGINYYPAVPGNAGILESMFYTNFTSATCPPNRDGIVNSFACTYKAIAAAFTKSIRDADILANGLNAKDTAPGIILHSATFVNVQFWWLTLPLMLWALSIGVLAGAWIQTRKANIPLWRENLVPLVFLLREGEAEVPNQENIRGMRDMETANNVRVKLRSVDGEMKFSRSTTRSSFVPFKNGLRGRFRRLVSEP
jgi:hypothetical protein